MRCLDTSYNLVFNILSGGLFHKRVQYRPSAHT